MCEIVCVCVNSLCCVTKDNDTQLKAGFDYIPEDHHAAFFLQKAVNKGLKTSNERAARSSDSSTSRWGFFFNPFFYGFYLCDKCSMTVTSTGLLTGPPVGLAVALQLHHSTDQMIK